MNTSYIIKKTEKKGRRSKLLPILILMLIVVAGCLNEVLAQSRNNQSDWNVPPPLAPRNIKKGNTPSGKQIVLTLSDIPAISLPPAPAVQMPVLAAIATTAPLINAPGQPVILDADAGLPEIPLPSAPDAPPLPKQSSQDAQVSPIADLPVPPSPELPAFPAEPKPSKQTTVVNGLIPVMPDVISPLTISLPTGGVLIAWPTPGIPENISFKLVIPAGSKAIKPRGKGVKKVKSKLIK